MIRWLLRKAIGKFERDWNYDASYMRDMIDASPRAAWLFSRVTALGQFRRDVPWPDLPTSWEQEATRRKLLAQNFKGSALRLF